MIRLYILLVLSAAHIVVTNSSNSGRLLCSQNDTIQLPSPPSRINSENILLRLRNQIEIYNSKNNQTIDAIYVTTSDEHQNEFVSDYNKRLQYISGFSGSNGEAIVTLRKAVFWTDGRYYLQADEELDCNWELMQPGYHNYHSKQKWLNNEFPNGANIWADAKLISAIDWITLELSLQDFFNENFTLVTGSENLVDEIWINHNDTFNPKDLDGYVVNESFTGQSAPNKINLVRMNLTLLKADAIIVTALDEIAWVLNVRGGDIPYAKLLEAYLIISMDDVILYADMYKLKNISSYYSTKHPNFLTIKPYQDIWTNFENISAGWKQVLLPDAVSYNKGVSKKIYDLVPLEKRLYEESPIVNLKAVKNSIEILGMEAAQIRDSVAMCQFFHYLEENYTIESESWDELRVVEVLYQFRSKQNLFVDLSFPTIAGVGPHGALPHYMPNNFTSSLLYNNSTLVIDSGGQYYDGTIDTTRTIHLGNPTDEHKEAYTRVLMGCIQLSSLVFPDQLPLDNMDVLTRFALWEMGYDYSHGTGHGVGASLNVHEAPITIYYSSSGGTLLQPGYFFTIEPGFYLKNHFGVRLENIVKVIIKEDLKYPKKNERFLGFEDITLVPYAKNLIDLDLLSKNQIRWLNKYNERIRNLVGLELLNQNLNSTYQWLLKNTEPISM